MKDVDATPLDGLWKFESSVNITHVSLEWAELRVMLMSGGDKKVATVKFTDIVGFRLLDEGDLLEFWPACSAHNGWLFEIHMNGWFDLESLRPGFIRDRSLNIFEYFIASQGGCVNVLSASRPQVEIFSI